MSAKIISDANESTPYRVFTIASQAYTIGDIVAYSPTGAKIIPATSSTTTTQLCGVAMETVTSSATTLLVSLFTVSPKQIWEVTSTNTADTTHNYQRMVLTDATAVNNTGTDSTSNTAVFRQTGKTGANKIVGSFLMVPGVT